jgi:hypothetical protein
VNIRIGNVIPKRVVQTDKTAALPVRARAAVANIRLLNPDFDYIFFDNAAVEDFVRTHYPEYMELFHSFPVPIQRYDFWRYLAIHKLGGFYFDVDVFLAASLEPLLIKECVFPFERLTWSEYLRRRHGMYIEIGNYAFGAAPGHPFIEAVIENCVKAFRDEAWRDEVFQGLPKTLRRELFVIYTTGPGLVSRTFAEYGNREAPVEILYDGDVCDKASWNQFGSYGVHMMQSSWRKSLGSLRRRILNHQARRNEDRAIAAARAGYRQPPNGR